MHVRGIVLPVLLAATVVATPARPQSQACDDLADVAQEFISKESPLAKLFGVKDAKDLADAYLDAPEGSKFDAIGKALGKLAITVVGGFGSKVVMRGGKAYVDGVEWTIGEAERLQTQAFLCGGVSAGSGQGIQGPFETTGAQAIAPRITCENFADWLDTPEKFTRFRDYFKGYYSRNLTDLGYHQERLDAQWKVIETTWRVREAERQLKKLQADLTRRLDEKAKNACPRKAPVPAELGADTSDPAKLPEPSLPPEGMLVLVETVVTPHSLDPSITHSAAPQKNMLSAYYGESVCAWSAPPKALVTQEVFGIDFSLSVASKNQQRYSEALIVRTGFSNVNSLLNELYVGVEPGGSKSAQGHLELGTGDLAFAADYMTWYLQVGGCGGNVDYVYKFRKP